jgi:hypothetical protein
MPGARSPDLPDHPAIHVSLPVTAQATMRPTRIRQMLEQYAEYDLTTRRGYRSSACAISSHDEPRTYQEAISSPDAKHWRMAMDEEFRSLQNNNTWTLWPLPADRLSISCKWIFKLKLRANGTIDRYKARLIARGFIQQQGIDYSNTFSPVIKHDSVCTFIALLVATNMEFLQFDIKAAFLNAKLDGGEELYMDQLEGYFHLKNPDYCCQLARTIYGLK